MKTLRMIVVLVLLTFVAQAVFAQSESNCKIKGFWAKDGKKLYLVPGHRLYDKIQVNTESGEQWFCTVEEAESAGFMFVPDPNNPQLRPAATGTTPTRAPIATPTPQPKPKPQQAEQAVTEQQPPAETPQEQPTEMPVQAGRESQPIEMQQPTMETFPEISPEQGMMMLMGVLIPALLFAGAIALILIIAWWKIFTKAGQPGWASLIPIYNTIVLIQIAGMPLWTFLGLFIPMINVIVWFLICLKLAQSFGKGAGYALGLFFLPFIFYPLLAFSSAEYSGI
ncbi:hypothetical protein U14_02948 [Candidatus Moduliflexus flocculans]|uniref:Signal peptidase I n=1 Tax=Candidatus Moduliflexus flocculans TaxID=1499966 RepID=A0A081BMT7_9BACT|nr:hypothetical protein U14_02948 [Candidatus Moduliflexus flocculans]